MMKEKITNTTVTETIVAPVHLKKLEDICATFCRSKDTIKRWRKEGAPIAFDGWSYCAEYNQLQAWLVKRCRN